MIVVGIDGSDASSRALHFAAAEAVLRGSQLTAVAAWVDLRLVPHRLTPGFQRRLSSRSLLMVYTLFGMGLAAGSYLAKRHGRERSTD